MKILSTIITPKPRPMPLGMFDPMPEVVATFQDGSTRTLFSFYPDEISFQASDFTGLTEEEASAMPAPAGAGTATHFFGCQVKVRDPIPNPCDQRLFQEPLAKSKFLAAQAG